MNKNLLSLILVVAFVMNAFAVSALEYDASRNGQNTLSFMTEALRRESIGKPSGSPKLPIATNVNQNISLTIYEVDYFNVKVVNVDTEEVVYTYYFNPLESASLNITTATWPAGNYKLTVTDRWNDESYYLDFSFN